jgi:integrase
MEAQSMSDTQAVLTDAEQKSRKRREAGSGCLIPPRAGITKYWTVQVRDNDGKLVRRTRLNSGAKVKGELKPGYDPRLPESWTNISAARILLKQWLEKVSKGDVAVGHDPSQLHYADLRTLYLRDYAEQGHRSLRRSPETGVEYVDCLKHLDTFMGCRQADDIGVKVSNITVNLIDKFKEQRKAEGATSATINRSLAALRRMFSLAVERGTLKFAPFIKMLPEDDEIRKGFLEIEDYDKLYAEFGRTVKNVAKGTERQPFAYIQPVLQMGFYTGMRKEEILGLRWSRVDLAGNVIRLLPQDAKNKTGRVIPLIDGLPETLEKIRQKNPQVDGNDYVFLGSDGERIGSFRKAWAQACIETGMKTTLNGIEVTSHFSKGPECCPYCIEVSKAKPGQDAFPIEKGKYVGLTFHDLRRSAVRNLVRAGVSRHVAMKITGHKTEEVFERYNITSAEDVQDAGEAVAEYLKAKRAEAAKAASTPRLKLVKS